jgi:hypothetical protein
MVGSTAANLAAGFTGASTSAVAAVGSGAAAAAASSPAAEEERFELRSRLGDDSERQSLYEDVLQRLPWEEADDDDAHTFGDSMQEQRHCWFLSRRWGPQQPRQQQHRQRLFGDAGLGLQRPGAEQLLGGAVSEGSLEWYEAQLLEVSIPAGNCNRTIDTLVTELVHVATACYVCVSETPPWYWCQQRISGVV